MTYGVGAMVASGNESFIVAGIDRWDRDEAHEFHEPRLERRLGVHAFMRPPSTGESTSWDVPVYRFPRWYSCPSCHRLNDIKFFQSPIKGLARCGECEEDLVPSRFVIACENGHLDDFPYFSWVHKEDRHPEGSAGKLRLKTTGESAGLRDVVIECGCGAKQSMDGAFGKEAMKRVRPRCRGEHPHLGRGNGEDCDETPRTVQRGASSVWFSETLSAISIPPWSESAFRLLDRHWAIIRHMPEEALPITIKSMKMADDNHSVEDLVEAAIYRRRVDDGEVEPTDIKDEEYDALTRTIAERSRHDQFVCVPAKDPGELAKQWAPTINQVRRLREVRVLTGFSRLKPPAGSPDPDADSEGQSTTVKLPGREQGWLPAIEVNGEGVFLEFGSDHLKEWEKRYDVIKRVTRIADNYEKSFAKQEGLVVSPRFVMLHTLAHALIDQWALDAGYSAAALKERLYVSEDRAGVLIYTATSDSAGSLGGVVGMTEDGRLDGSLKEAIKRAAWCSADPICIESANQGSEALNLAACHACSLIPETSCDYRNSLLDRALLIGTPEDPTLGYFAELV